MFRLHLNFMICCVVSVSASALQQTQNGTERMKTTISMPPVATIYPDQYMCYAKSLAEIGDTYILKLTIDADASVVHHVATAVCEDPVHKETTWDCTRQQGYLCEGDAVNFGVWDEYTKQKGVFEFPKDVSLKIGRSTKMKYFLVEVHFMEMVKDPKASAANVTLDFIKTPTKYNFQTYSLLNSGFIPGNKNKGVFSEAACLWERPPAFAFRYYVHTHHYGILVEGFLVRNNSWTLIGSQLSMGKDMDLHDVPGGPVEIRPGDIIASRCLYINSGETPVNFGMSSGEEMCEFQIDIGFDPKYEKHFRRPPACITQSPDFTFCDHARTAGLCSK